MSDAAQQELQAAIQEALNAKDSSEASLRALALCRRALPTRDEWVALAVFAIVEGDQGILSASATHLELKQEFAQRANFPRKFREPFLTLAARENNLEATRFLLGQGCDPNATGFDGLMPVTDAILNGPAGRAVWEILLPVTTANRPDLVISPLRMAVLQRNEPGARALLTAGADPPIVSGGKNALGSAVAINNAAMTRVLAPFFDFSKSSPERETVVNFAIQQKAWLALDELLAFFPARDAQSIVDSTGAEQLPHSAARLEPPRFARPFSRLTPHRPTLRPPPRLRRLCRNGALGAFELLFIRGPLRALAKLK